MPLLDVGFLVLDLKDIGRAIEDEQYKEGYKSAGFVAGCVSGLTAYGIALTGAGAVSVCGVPPWGTLACVAGGVISCGVAGVIGSEAMGLYYEFELAIAGDSLLGKSVLAPLAVPINQATDGVIQAVGDTFELNWNDPFEDKIRSFLEDNAKKMVANNQYDLYECESIDGTKYYVYHDKNIKGPKAFEVYDNYEEYQSARVIYIIDNGGSAYVNDWQGKWYKYYPSSGTALNLGVQQVANIDPILGGVNPADKASFIYDPFNSTITQKAYAGGSRDFYLYSDFPRSDSVKVTESNLPSDWCYDLQCVDSGFYKLQVLSPLSALPGDEGTLKINLSSSYGNQDLKYFIGVKGPEKLASTCANFTVNGKSVVSGDYIASTSDFLVSYPNDLIITDYYVEVFSTANNQAVYSSGQQTISKSQGDTSLHNNGAIFINLPEALPEGEFRMSVTIQDINHQRYTIDSPTFQVSSTFNVTALFAPNPFSPNGDGLADTTKIFYQLSQPAQVKIRLVDLAGRLVRHWGFAAGVPDRSTIGNNEVEWDGRDEAGNYVKNGLYLGYILAESGGETKKTKLQIAVLK
ncbi:hypothetical protein COT42_01310 [Candidatus Saganbacteria bacterium CG08_land_8_20_14_0_20_45_16]|uniref:FlgD Ig-like domain-containing protein n=1 Tax=Candidatus Saganbacteria bacterium CG08_land_8_20_14_0_20_45_16 TaxID=2014293 RepID=A0A2H0Y3J2_UNCSA|nr:MAG: hypothetical protein COT42_01310 [Candidatus Saganbacteria bacterium CG08_land_8_20_14_0_20_45_16]